MKAAHSIGWQSIQSEVLRRIHAREWPPGHVIPNEIDLAKDFGCARATVNRALQSLADSGVLERRRKAGTRVVLHPVSRTTLDIPILRQEIEAAGKTYDYRLLLHATDGPNHGMDLPFRDTALHVQALHLADMKAYVFEDRWINLSAVPKASEQSFDALSANEWLIQYVPFTHGEIAFSAQNADAETAKALGVDIDTALFVIDRTTFDQDQIVTQVRLSYGPGYKITAQIGP